MYTRLTSLAVIVILALGGSSTLFAAPAQTETQNVSIAIATDILVPCANNGAGEIVHLAGNLHLVMHTTVDANGGVRSFVHSQPQGIQGVGAASGDVYRGVGSTLDRFSSRVGSVSQLVSTIRVAGPGPNNDLTLHQVMRVTVDANGNAAVSPDHVTARCSSIPPV